MAIYTQHATKDAASATSTTLGFGGTTGAGNLIVAAIRVGGTSTCAVTDDASGGSNNYGAGPSIQGSDIGLFQTGLGTLYIFSAAQFSKAATTLTFTLTGGAATMRIAIYEYPHVLTASPLDKTSILYTASGSTSVSSGNTATTTQATAILVGALAGNGAETPVAGTTQAYTLEDSVARLFIEDVQVSATGTFTADFTSVNGSVDHIAALAVYKLAPLFNSNRFCRQAVNRAGTY